MKNIFLKLVWILFISLILLGVPRIAGLFADQFNYANIDPDGAFAWISIHHIVQALLLLPVMFILARTKNYNFGFSLGNKKVGLYFVRLFAKIFAAYILVSLIIVYFAGTFNTFPYPLTSRNILGQLGFQLFLSGPSEELIFRAFAITMLFLHIKGSFFKGKLSSANIIAAIIFALAHVRFEFFPFSLSYDPFQLVYAAALGLAYGICYERSKSMIYPMIMHSMSNVVAVGVSILAGFIL